ncbi:MAG TPA: CHAT domain-containing tetratricopeptide repeat protein, partial [Thermoanaerobaculia bacterium]|nr:CHAT domain-containing tetratricopeptide repeat protein [Thermoanaerobaculia bacterium]
LGISNQAGEREAVESLLIPASTGAWTVDVLALETGVPPGRYRIEVEELSDPQRIRAESLLTDMGRLRKIGDGESKRRLLALGDEALPLWQALGLKREEARTLYVMAGARRGLGDDRQALALYEKALPIADEALQSHTLTAMGLCRWSLGEHTEALALLDRALEIERRRGDAYGEAVTLANVCLVRHSRGEWRESIPCYEEALRRLREVKAPDSEAIFRGNLAGVYDLLGEPLRARDEYEATLGTLRALGERRSELQVLNNLAVVLAGMGETSEALLLYGQALDLARSLGEQGWVGRVLYNRGTLYLGLGETPRAAADFQESLALRRKVADRRGEINSLNALARSRASGQSGDPAAARELHRQALALAREAGDRYLEATSLSLWAPSDPAALDQAIGIFRALGHRRGLAGALSQKGEALLLAGWPEEALAPLGEALALSEGVEDRAGQSETLVLLGQAERRLGHPEAALERVDAALALIESLRAEVVVPDLRAAFLASRQRAFELAIGLRMELHRADDALALSERARARTLLDLLGEARADVRQGVDPKLREQEREVAARLAAKARRRIELLGGAATDAQKEASARDLRETLAESDRLEAEIRRTNPRYAGLLHPRPLDSAAIRALLDPRTLLLEYSLGEERSFLWAVTPASVEVFELPGRAKIEALARQVYEGLRTLDVGDPEASARETAARRELSRMILGPVADRLADRRLAIVADGALEYVPFAALPSPADPNAPVVERHEIVVLPSAAVLALREPAPAPVGEAGPSIAILADPVFDSRDPRVRQASSPGPAPESPAQGISLTRLAASSREAEAISELAPGRVWTALGFQASRATAFGGELARHRIVHFATHGVIDSETPELSGLVLSLVDEEGRPQEGFLGLDDIYNLDLRADLVVLSGCETALGREMRGEGLVGLTRGFLYAGAARVLASLWQVQDRPATELMVRFYRALLQDRLPPAAALRAAQLSLLRERRWRDPFYWGAFVLQGDWR